MVRGEIWLINLSPTVGAEISKTRPAVIVNDDTIGKLPCFPGSFNISGTIREKVGYCFGNGDKESHQGFGCCFVYRS